MNIQNDNSISFKSLYTNKKFLNTLKFASDNAPLLTSGATVIGATLIRPLSIYAAPKSSRKNKEYACAKSIASSMVGFGLTAALLKPVSKSLDRITKAPENFLSNETIKSFTQNKKSLNTSKSFSFLKQVIKMNADIFSIFPKAAIVSAIIVPTMNVLFYKGKNSTEPTKSKKELSFKGGFDKPIAKIINNKNVQKFANAQKDSNFVQHSMALKDFLATGMFALATKFNKKINNEDKKPLIANSIISTGLTTILGYAINSLTKKPTEKLVENIKKANEHDADLNKYLTGIKVIKPILILATLYYCLIPLASTTLAERFTTNKNS